MNSVSIIDSEGMHDYVENILCLQDHYDAYPNHPWNKWRLIKRGDENHYTEAIKYIVNNVTLSWLKDSGKLHRIGAPAYISLNDEKRIDAEEWRVNHLLHRTDGPAFRLNFNLSYSLAFINKWYLFNYSMTVQQHKEIMEIYNELGDWSLAFNLSSFLVYDEKSLEERIYLVMNES